MTKHLEKLNATRTRLKELERRLETLKGPKARGPVSDEIRDLSDQIKGHEKEIRQKWPELGDNF